MDEQQHKPNERLERMLRQWGAGEAVRDTAVGPCPLPQDVRHIKGKRPTRGGLLRWVPPAAAAAMLLAAAVLFVLSRGDRAQVALEGPPLAEQRPGKALEEKVKELQGELARTQEELENARKEVNSISAQLHAANAKLASAVQPEAVEQAVAKREKELFTKFAGEKAALKADAEREIGALEKAVSAKADELHGLDGQLAEVRKSLKLAMKDLSAKEDELKDVRRRQAAAAQELARQQELHNRTLASLGKASAELAELKARFDFMLDDFQRMYLASAAPGEEHLAARQRAARGARIVERCALLRSVVSKSSARELLDSIEVVFTRLDVLDPYDMSAAESFARLLRRTDLTARIDKALAEADGRPQVRVLLFESKLILSGVEGVG